jgi:hypothetical protein
MVPLRRYNTIPALILAIKKPPSIDRKSPKITPKIRKKSQILRRLYFHPCSPEQAWFRAV